MNNILKPNWFMVLTETNFCLQLMLSNLFFLKPIEVDYKNWGGDTCTLSIYVIDGL